MHFEFGRDFGSVIGQYYPLLWDFTNGVTIVNGESYENSGLSLVFLYR